MEIINDDLIKMSDIKTDFKKPLKDSSYIKVTDCIKIYYEPNINNEFPLDINNQCGFKFIVLLIFCVSDFNTVKKINEYEYYTEILYHGIAYFDGIRHFYMGNEQSKNEGYLFYINLDDHIKIFKELKKLEIQYCSE